MATGRAAQSKPKKKPDPTVEERMSTAGQAARRHVVLLEGRSHPDQCVNAPDCEGGFDEIPAPDLQAETSIAVDSTGQHVVLGFNDFRGFSMNPIRVSGYMYSDDGGATFVDGGQLPSPGTELIGTTQYPQVFGDPEVKYLGGCSFIYASIIVKKFSATRAVQTMGIHRSLDCGHTWEGPYEVTPATNPHGAVTASGIPLDAADKEFMDVDRETGRVILTWSNFTPFAPGGVEISSTFSDDVLTGAPPTWSPRQIVAATVTDGQSSIPRFAASSTNAYVAWRRFPSFYTNKIGFARSTNNGASWLPPVDLTAEFFTMDQVLGNDRVNTSPSLAVDNSGGKNDGTVYIVYANNDLRDGADVIFQKSTDEGVTFSAPLRLNSRPGDDRAQWFPWVTVDRDSGRVYVFYYDQGIAKSGDLSEVTYTFSDDGGKSWSPPVPVTDRPFKAGWGNDTGQPNLGDYNQAVAQSDDVFIAWASSIRPPGGFADGQPVSSGMTVPDVFARRIPASRHKTKVVTVNLNAMSFTESGGNGKLDPGDVVHLQLSLRNYVTNPLNARRLNGLQATLSTSTVGVVVLTNHSPYSKLDPGEVGANKKDFVLQLAPTFVPGTPIELKLEVEGPEHGSMTLLHTVFTGTPAATVLLSEDFNTTAPGAIPAGWAVAHGGGSNVVPWTTSNTFCETASNAAFHQNANDNGTGNPVRRERLFSPAFDVPVSTDYVTIDFDVCYDTEEDPNFNILAFDGFFLRLADLTPGRLLRSVLAEAFEDEFTTGLFQHYPRHFPRSSDPQYFQDMSAWAGFSGGFRHVRMRLPGMAGSRAQLVFEFTQDSSGTCQDVGRPGPCGVMFDNLVVRSVVSTAP
jgi:hypothetical protein